MSSGLVPERPRLAYRVEQQGEAWAWEIFVIEGTVVASGVAGTHTQAMADAFHAALELAPRDTPHLR